LPSIVSALCGAKAVTITDHPSSPALTMAAIEQNVRINVLERDKARTSTTPPEIPTGSVDIFGYTWGTSTFYLPSSYGRPAPTQPSKFNRIIVADCLWMPSQHENLVKTILTHLDPASSSSCALVVAGFHTGREVVRSFFEVATGDYALPAFDDEATREHTEAGMLRGKSGGGLETSEIHGKGRLQAAQIFEIDVNDLRRPWQSERKGETKDAAKRWCVVAVLTR
jgi:predicted nicotinamide N-methyase